MQVGLAGCGLYVLSLRSTPLKANALLNSLMLLWEPGSARKSASPVFYPLLLRSTPLKCVAPPNILKALQRAGSPR